VELSTIHKEEQVSEALKKLADQRILSLPTVDDEGLPIGILSMKSVVHRFVGNNSKQPDQALVETMTGRVKETELETVHAISESDTLWNVLKLMVGSQTHRVLVYKDDKGTTKFKNIVTQSLIMRLICCMMDFLPEVKKSVGDLHLGTKSVVTIEDTRSALEAFQLMHQTNMSAVAVVGQSGSIVGNISVNDFKLVAFDSNFSGLLTSPISEYLSHVNRNALKQHPPHLPSEVQIEQFSNMGDSHQVPNVIACTRNSSLALVIKLVIFHRVHRVYVLDEESRPTGVISISDILECISQGWF